jgi:hypothetical protein
MKAIAPRLFGIVARNAPVIALMRRGPSRWTQLIRWDTENDRFEEGQWVHARVMPRRSDLSPDGKLLIYFATSYRSDPATWTAISRVPHWTAINFWPWGDSWGGGGLFFSNSQFALYKLHAEDYPIFEKRLTRDGWRIISDWQDLLPNYQHSVMKFAKLNRSKTLELLMDAHSGIGPKRPGIGVYYETYQVRVCSTGHTIDLTNAAWAEFDFRDRLVFTRQGIACAAAFEGDELVQHELYAASHEPPQTAPSPGDAKQPARLHELTSFPW